jgi:hypothetical protein
MANSIVISLKARSAAFNRSMQRASKRLSNFGKGVARISGKVAKFGMLAGAAAAGGMAFFGKRSIDMMDAVGKMSDELGIATKALTGLEHAAQINGASLDILHKGLGIFVRRMGEAKMGVGEARKGLELLGLSADSLSKMPLEKQMLEISEAISKLPTQSDRAAAAFMMFGRQGVSMLNMLQQGKGTLQGLMTEAEELGLTFNRLDASYAERINDSMTRLKSVVGGAFRGAMVSILPPLTAIMEKLVTWGKSIMPWLGATTSKIMGGMSQVFGIFKTYFSVVFNAIINVLSSFGVSFGSTGDVISSVIDGIVGFLKWLAVQSIKVITMLEVGFTNWKTVAELAAVAVTHSIVWLGNTIVHWIGTVIPDLLSWFGRNWKDIFVDMANLVATIFKNMWKNIKSFFSNLWKALKGEKTDWKFTALTDGFEATLTEMPKIAERKLGETEKALKNRMASLGKQLSSEYEQKVSKRLAKLEDNTKKPQQVNNKLAEKQKEIAKKKLPSLDNKQLETSKLASGSSMNTGPGEFKVMQSRRLILQPSNKENKTADAAKKTAKNTAELVSLMREKGQSVAFV